MKALRKQRLCSFLWGWGKWENRPCSIQKRPGISLPDRFFHFPRWKHMPPYSQFLSDSPSQGSSTYPCDREKGTAYAVPPVNLWLSPDRASGLRKRQKGQLALSFLSIHGFHRTAQRSEKKDKRDSLRRPSCQSMAFTRPRQRSEKKTKGTAYAVPPVNLRFSPDRASGLGKRQKGQLALSFLSIHGFHRTAPAV